MMMRILIPDSYFPGLQPWHGYTGAIAFSGLAVFSLVADARKRKHREDA
ncbi:MAG: hypothetical protein ACJ8IQ_10930 [Chthoniobacterales bacterium]